MTNQAYAQKSISKRRAKDRAATYVLGALVAIVMAIVVAIVIYVIATGAHKLFDISFLTSNPQQFRAGGGIGPEIFNSFYLLVLTLLISLPISLGAAIYLTQYARGGRFVTLAKTAIETLSSLPSIVVGLFGMLTFVISSGWGFSIISGAMTLTVFNVPILVRVMTQALESVPKDQRDAGLALGLTRWETTTRILVPAAMPSIITGVILSAGRVFGEAAALIYTAGQSAPKLNFLDFNLLSPTCPWNIFRPAETLAVHIWKINSEGVVPDVAAVSAGTAATLMASILVFNLLARLIGRALERKMCAE